MKAINIKFIIIGLLTLNLSLINLSETRAQQIPMYAAYTVNNFLLSPSFAGTANSDARLMAINRLQFAGIEGAPVTFMFTGDGPISKQNMGLGATIYTDKLGLLRQTGVNLAYSYHLRLGEARLHFGLGGEVGQLGLDFDNIVAEDMTDELLNIGSANKIMVSGNFGMHLTYNDFTLGFAAPQIFGNRVTYQDYVSNTTTGYQFQRHYLALMSYRFSVKQDVFDIEPIVMMRTISGLSPQFDINIKGIIKDKAFLAVGYRSDYALSFGGGVNVSDNMMIGYSYDMAINEIAGYSFGSHEFILGYNFYKGLDRRDMEKKLKEERENERKRSEELYGGKLNKLEKDLEEQNEMNRLQKEEIDRLQNIIKSYGEELDSMKNLNFAILTDDIKKQQQFDVNGDGTVDAKDDTNGDGKVDESDFLKDASGKTIVPKTVNVNPYNATSNPNGKYLVVIASFKAMNYAIEHQQMLKRNGDTEQTFIHHSASGTWYYVFKKAFDNPTAAQDYLNTISTEGLEEF
ncbi:MAG: PorP/SprF family type IX secretion system membrane protein, partial [Bacteroidia bacterium]